MKTSTSSAERKKMVISTKNLSILLGLLVVFLLVSSASGKVIEDNVYSALAPCYSENIIKSFGPVSIDKTGQLAPTGITTNFKTFVSRDAWYKKLDKLYDNTKYSVDEKFSYPRGPVISYGYDALGSVSVGIYDKQDVKEETIDQIYAFISDESRKQGIETPPVVFFRSPMPYMHLNRDDAWRPVIGGVQGTSSLGTFTIGFAATRSGQEGVITVGHAGSVGTAINQPGSGYPIGTITVSSGGANSDSAFIAFDNTAGNVFETSQSQPGVSGGTDPWLNLGVTKSGITTGVTSGTVISQTSLYNSFFGTTIYDQWYASFSGTSGDSGSPVYFKDANQQIQIVGIYWGQGTYSCFSPISSVLGDLA